MDLTEDGLAAAAAAASNENGNGDVVSVEWSFSDRVKHWLGEPVTTANFPSVQNAMVFYVGIGLASEGTIKKEAQHEYCKKRYSDVCKEVVSAKIVGATLVPRLNHLEGSNHSEMGITGMQIRTRYRQLRTHITADIMKLLPAGLSSIPSGKNLCDVFDKAKVDIFVNVQKKVLASNLAKGKTNEELVRASIAGMTKITVKDLPPAWMHKNYPQKALLSVMVFRHYALFSTKAVPCAPAIGKSRASVKREKAEKAATAAAARNNMTTSTLVQLEEESKRCNMEKLR